MRPNNQLGLARGPGTIPLTGLADAASIAALYAREKHWSAIFSQRRRAASSINYLQHCWLLTALDLLALIVSHPKRADYDDHHNTYQQLIHSQALISTRLPWHRAPKGIPWKHAPSLNATTKQLKRRTKTVWPKKSTPELNTHDNKYASGATQGPPNRAQT